MQRYSINACANIFKIGKVLIDIHLFNYELTCLLSCQTSAVFGVEDII
jgi:hypothetical protein